MNTLGQKHNQTDIVYSGMNRRETALVVNNETFIDLNMAHRSRDQQEEGIRSMPNCH